MNPRMRYALSLAVACVLGAVVAASWGAEPTLKKLLPKDQQVKGWTLFPKSYVYAQGKGLTSIYDGGYKLYLDRGVTEAVEQIYRGQSGMITLTVHGMQSERDSARFYEYWKQSAAKQKSMQTLPLSGPAFTYSADGAANGYLCNGRYLFALTASTDSNASRAALIGFLKWGSAAADSLQKPKPRRRR
jgi:hypothetical protein